MTISNIKDSIDSNIHKVWETVLVVDKYTQWRSDLSKTEVINEEQFIEYTKNGYPTTFTITVVEPHKRWEFDMENSNMKGHWIGIFTSIDDKTEIDFTEQVTAKKFYMKPFVKSYLKKQQTQFVMDLKRILEKYILIYRGDEEYEKICCLIERNQCKWKK
ncbi:MAG: SRPBCC family protein [Massilimicrobiota sp.]|nr:SRPBCC family protein [Massilimicrobiota sp.]